MHHLKNEHDAEYQALWKRQGEVYDTVTERGGDLVHEFENARTNMDEDQSECAAAQFYDMGLIRDYYNAEHDLVTYIAKLEAIVSTLAEPQGVSGYLGLRERARLLITPAPIEEVTDVKPDES